MSRPAAVAMPSAAANQPELQPAHQHATRADACPPCRAAPGWPAPKPSNHRLEGCSPLDAALQHFTVRSEEQDTRRPSTSTRSLTQSMCPSKLASQLG
jgi:hypothetical protein